MVPDVTDTLKNEPRMRINVFNTEGFCGENGITPDLLSIDGDTRLLFRDPRPRRIRAYGGIGKLIWPTTFVSILLLVGVVVCVLKSLKSAYV